MSLIRLIATMNLVCFKASLSMNPFQCLLRKRGSVGCNLRVVLLPSQIVPVFRNGKTLTDKETQLQGFFVLSSFIKWRIIKPFIPC